ncbi:MAG: hypothetical protein LBN03_00975, partial [Bifidobacteriaceae bacterium]|nr:hypothetical protein [Bifidobacteriaceae bacterium]
MQQGKLDYFDTYTYFASDFHPTTHEWLQDIITALIYNFGGVNLGYNLLAGFYSLLICLSI